MKLAEMSLAGLLALSVLGCQSTAEGVKEDARDNSINASGKIKEGFDNGANMAKNAAEDLSASAKLTPRIKNAINADPNLNQDGNLIDVDTTPDLVTLNGHVKSKSDMERVVKITKEEMAKSKAEQKLVNKLTVQPMQKK